MKIVHEIVLGHEVKALIDGIPHKLDLIHERMKHMATQAQLDKFKADVVALIQASTDTITAALAAAQAAPPEQADAAIDTLDTQVTAATQALNDAAAKIRTPPASPPA